MIRAGRARSIALALAIVAGSATARGQESPLSDARIAALPDSARAAWQGYLARSRMHERDERAAMAAELARAGMAKMTRAPFAAESFARADSMTLAWLASDAGRRLADNALTFQTPTGGWTKHLDLAAGARRPGQSWFSESDDWVWIGTIDFGSTVSEIRLLLAADSARADERYRDAARRGLGYLLEARMPNGCWPQVYPLMGGYHDGVAFASSAMSSVLALLDDVAAAPGAAFDTTMRANAAEARDAGIGCVLAMQRPALPLGAAWGLFHDPLTGDPIAARSWELASYAPLETAELLDRLLAVRDPDARTRQAAHAAAAWLARQGLAGYAYDHYALTLAPNAAPLWPRLVSLADGAPVFSDRDGVPRRAWAQLTDRRSGYIWFGTEPAAVLERYARWAESHPATGELAPARVPTDSIEKLPGRRPGLDTSVLLGPARLARLAPAVRAGWERYLSLSRTLAARDRAAMDAELASVGRTGMRRGAWAHDFEGMAKKHGAWFATDTARRIGESILSYQTPSGGWSKHVDFRGGVRLAGVSYNGETAQWRFIPTIDNGATTEELRFLSRADSVRRDPRHAAAFARGVRYLADAQMPNGCWPQVFPLQGGYHDAVTFNDDAIVHVATLMREIANGAHPIADAPLREIAAASVRRAVECMVSAQVVVRGRRTIWAQQHDPLTLAPIAARSYELASLGPDESAAVARFLLDEPEQTPRVAAAVSSAARWFRANAIGGLSYEHYVLRRSPGAGPLWGRMVDVGTGRPIFANRDGVKLDQYDRLTDRRTGYRWYTAAPRRFLRDWSDRRATPGAGTRSDPSPRAP